MRSFWAIIPRYIIKNKKRVVFIALGIIISMSVVVSLTFIKESLTTALYDKTIKDMGGVYDLAGYSTGFLDYESIKNEKEVKDISLVKPLGVYSIPDTKYSMNICSYEDNIGDLLNFNLIEGRYPRSGNEIAIEKWILDLIPGEYKVGDTINLKYTTKYRGRNTEFNMEGGQATFFITGTFEHIFRKNNLFGEGKAYATPEFVNSLLEETPEKQVEDIVYISLKDGYTAAEARESWVETNKYKSTGFGINEVKAKFEEDMIKYNSILSIIFIILGGISSIIIYNIFSVSIAERIKEFGMLRAIGCPPWKIKTMVLGEGLIMGVVFIPIGIVVGSYVTKGIVKLTSGLSELGGVSTIPLNIVIIATIIGLVTIIIGTYFPARKAARISPVEAISSNSNLELKGNKIKVGLENSNCILKKFKFETNIAYVNLIRNKKRFITTIISITITVTLFIGVNYIVGATNPVSVFKDEFGADFKVIGKTWITNEKINEVRAVKGVKEVIGTKVCPGVIELKEENMTEDGMKYLEKQADKSNFMKEALKGNRYIYDSLYIGYKPGELENLKNYVVDGEIDINKMENEPILILAQNLNDYKDTKVEVGDYVTLWCDKYDEGGNKVGHGFESFTVGAIVDEKAFKHLEPDVRSMVILSEPVMEEYLWIYGFQKVNIILEKGADYEKCGAEINKIFENVRGSQVYSFKEELKKVEMDNRQIVLAMYTIVIVVAIVSIINLINIMNMSAIMRKREFGFMRAMGLSEEQVKKIIRREGAIYGVVSGGVAAVLGTVISIIIASKSKILFGQEIIWTLPIINIAGTFIITILVTILSAVFPSRSLFNSSIIESIRDVD